jgi:hypothetical protein
MNELTEIPWFDVFANFTWILGASIILASFSYHEFLAHIEKTRRIEVFKRNSFKRPLHIGLILIAVGASASANKPFLAAIAGGTAVFLVAWFLRLSKINLFKVRKKRIEDKPG